jgi:PPK2 family polyphosphate:nucleotide phosphotransferase
LPLDARARAFNDAGMKPKEWNTWVKRLTQPFRVTSGKKFRLREVDPGDTLWMTPKDKPQARKGLDLGVEALKEAQERLYAHDRWSLLLIFQAMDAAGKDGAIKHVMSGVNPQGCQVYSFKAPSAEELDHDFLWRCLCRLPERGKIGIFNRSYYEETLVVRVHPELLKRQKLPESLVTPRLWKERFEDICAVERYLSRNGVKIVKFFLHVSKDEQKQRFLKRLDTPEKHWKFSESDIAERAHWDDYMAAYEDMIRNTASRAAPWYVVPADHKWFARAVISAAVTRTLTELDPRFPTVSADRRRALAAARAKLK